MASAISTRKRSSRIIEWTWQSNPNPSSKSEKAVWSHFSDIENLIIEEAYVKKQPRVMLDDCDIDLKQNVRISKTDENDKRPIKRLARNRETKHLREARFMDLPVVSGRSFGGEYGWIAPFITEIRRHLGLRPEKLPTKTPELIPMLVEKAAQGIIEEGKTLGREKEAEKMANMLLEEKNNTIQNVWKCCAYLYTLETFLYKTLNAAMRLVGDRENEGVWRSKIHTLGPFCLLLWDDPFNTRVKTNKTLYRGAILSDEQIATYKDLATDQNRYGSLQAFTSCSRNRRKAEGFGNTLFVMKICFAFTADLSSVTEYPEEEEELITPGVCFSVKSVEFDHKTNKHIITLQLRQRLTNVDKIEAQSQGTEKTVNDHYDYDILHNNHIIFRDRVEDLDDIIRQDIAFLRRLDERMAFNDADMDSLSKDVRNCERDGSNIA